MIVQPQPYGYYHVNEADQYTFYRLPKVLFTADRYKELTDGAKILYGLMLDRMGLSIKNGWVDAQDRVYIIFTLEDVQEHMNCQHGKSVKMLAELDTEKGVGLIERIKQGQGKPTIIYVRKFFDTSEVLTSEKRKSALPKNGSLDFRKTAANDTDINDTDINSSFPLHSPSPREDAPERKGTEAANMKAIEAYRDIILENIEYPMLLERYKSDRGSIDGIVDIMLETVCTARKTIRVAGDDYPAEFVKAKFLKLRSGHIGFVLDCMKKNTTEIRNVKKYLLAVLFNAPSTIDSHHTVLVKAKTRAAPNLPFNQFKQNEYDYEELEREITSN